MVVFLTNKFLELIPNNDDTLIIEKAVELVDDCHLVVDGKTIEFDYLIAYDQSFIEKHHLPFVMDGKNIITNWVGQSSIENIYIGNFQKAIEDLFEN
ncbi:MAG: hypothetical protein IJX78_07890 [Bacilli bacterium]|nr:hypothetical protein [Bacilli bacterium]